MAVKTGFVGKWLEMLWTVMSKTGNGYRKPSLKHTGRGKDRRADKRNGESKIQRMARLGQIGVRA